MKQTVAVLILILCASFVANAQKTSEVVKFVAPEKYPVAARAVRARGEVAVAVQIDANGKVISAKAVSGHPLLRAISEQTALKWEFSKDFAAANNEANLTFDYKSEEDIEIIEASEKAEETVPKFNHPSPFRVEIVVVTIVPKMLLLPRENGQIKPAYCELHNQLMGVEIQEIGYGLRSSNIVVKNEDDDDEDDENKKDFWEIQDEFFPNANLNKYGGTSNGMERAEVHFCQICRVKREEWLKK
jgi:TonB family protein